MCKPHKTGKFNDETQVFHDGFGKVRALQSANQDLRDELPGSVPVRVKPKSRSKTYGILIRRYDKDGKPKRWFHECRQWYASERSRDDALKALKKDPKPWTLEAYELIRR